MDDRKVNSKSHAEEIGAPESTHRNPCSPPDDTGFDNSRENCNSLAAVGFESQRVIASREHDTDNELPRQFNEVNEEKRESSEASSLKQGKIESREHDTELPRQFNEEKEEKRESEASHQKRGNIASREHDTELPRKFNEDNEEKRESRQFNEENKEKRESEASHQKQGKYFFYDSPLYEDTGVWIPVSVPPMLESENEEWARGFHSNGGYFPDGDMGWGQYLKEDKELTMWDVVVEMLLAARGKVSAFAKGDSHGCNFSWMSSHLLEQAWQEMAQTLTETNFGNVSELLEAEPPKWLGDSSASACMLCGVRFHPIMCSRHHCRFCGGIFCGECSKGRSLLPAKFRVSDPQRACDVCCVRLESVQPYLMNQVSHAAQLPTRDLTDLSTLRSWVNFPWGQSMENEIYKATNTIRGYSKVGYLKPEKSIPDIILRHAKGLAILSVAKVGVMVTFNIGTGLVIARRDDGSWSPPSAIASFGMGWGAQAGGELTDFIIVLRTNDAVKTFTGNMHISAGAGLSAAVGIVGRAVEADVRAGDGGCAACYTYSCSKGAFVGCSLEGSVFTTRTRQNSRFYGSQSITASDILLGSIPMPAAAAILYRALADLYQKLEK